MNAFEKTKALCDKAGISVYSLEKKLGFPKASLQSWKTNDPSLRKAIAVAEYFGISVNELLDDVKHTKCANVSTADLVDELKNRPGVCSRFIEPYQKVVVSVTGPMILMEVVD